MDYKSPPGPGMSWLVDKLRDIEEQLRTLQRPSGVDVGGLLQQVQSTLANINTTVATAISTNSYTKSVIDNKIANPPSGSAVTGDVSATGTMTANGIATFPAGMSSLDAKTRVLTSGWSSLWIDGTGRVGQSGSARRYKQDIEPAVIDTTAVLSLTPVQYHLKAAVMEFGDNARTEVGLIAEDLEPVAPWAIAYDAEGVVQGINYSTLTVALLAVVKSQSDQIAALADRLTKASF